MWKFILFCVSQRHVGDMQWVIFEYVEEINCKISLYNDRKLFKLDQTSGV